MRGSGTAVPLPTGAASAPGRPSRAGAGAASHSVVPVPVKSGGGLAQRMWERRWVGACGAEFGGGSQKDHRNGDGRCRSGAGPLGGRLEDPPVVRSSAPKNIFGRIQSVREAPEKTFGLAKGPEQNFGPILLGGHKVAWDPPSPPPPPPKRNWCRVVKRSTALCIDCTAEGGGGGRGGANKPLSTHHQRGRITGPVPLPKPPQPVILLAASLADRAPLAGGGGGGAERGRLGGANGTPCHIQHSPNTPTTGLRERGNDTSRSTGRSGRQNAATQRNMRREERVTVQGPVKEQQPDGVSHGGGGEKGGVWGVLEVKVTAGGGRAAGGGGGRGAVRQGAEAVVLRGGGGGLPVDGMGVCVCASAAERRAGLTLTLSAEAGGGGGGWTPPPPPPFDRSSGAGAGVSVRDASHGSTAGECRR